MIEQEMATKNGTQTGTHTGTHTWAMGDAFTMADCAAAPALYYANLVLPLRPTFNNTAAYLDSLMQRPSFARAVKEAEPFRALFPN
jgi:glutathione S-transferase